MFDPSIFDNLKVVLEGTLYDLDREGLIHITNRSDMIDLARMDRTFSMQYELPNQPRISLEIRLKSDVKDFAVELVNIRSAGHKPGCTIQLVYTVFDCQLDMDQLLVEQETLLTLWEQDVQIEQSTIQSFPFHSESSSGTPLQHTTPHRFKHESIVTLNKRIDESHITQISSLLDHTLTSIDSLHRLLESFL